MKGLSAQKRLGSRDPWQPSAKIALSDSRLVHTLKESVGQRTEIDPVSMARVQNDPERQSQEPETYVGIASGRILAVTFGTRSGAAHKNCATAPASCLVLHACPPLLFRNSNSQEYLECGLCAQAFPHCAESERNLRPAFLSPCGHHAMQQRMPHGPPRKTPPESLCGGRSRSAACGHLRKYQPRPDPVYAPRDGPQTTLFPGHDPSGRG